MSWTNSWHRTFSITRLSPNTSTASMSSSTSSSGYAASAPTLITTSTHHRRRRQGCAPHDRERHPHGPSQGHPPTGKRFSVDYVHWFRLAEGKVAELWAVRDELSRLQQLDLIPVPGES